MRDTTISRIINIAKNCGCLETEGIFRASKIFEVSERDISKKARDIIDAGLTEDEILTRIFLPFNSVTFVSEINSLERHGGPTDDLLPRAVGKAKYFINVSGQINRFFVRVYFPSIISDRMFSVFLFDVNFNDIVKTQYKLNLFEHKTYDDDEIMNAFIESERANYNDMLKRIWNIVIASLIAINDPAKFIIESAPIVQVQFRGEWKSQEGQDKNYIVLNIGEIQKRYQLGISNNKGLGRKSHPRRAHLRVLRSEKFKHKRGQTIKIPAIWVGPKETMINNRIYRVLVDK